MVRAGRGETSRRDGLREPFGEREGSNRGREASALVERYLQELSGAEKRRGAQVKIPRSQEPQCPPTDEGINMGTSFIRRSR